MSGQRSGFFKMPPGGASRFPVSASIRRTYGAGNGLNPPRSAPVFGRDLHVKAVGIEEIDGRYSIVCLKSGSGFGIRQLVVNFVRQAFRGILINMVYGYGEVRNDTLLFRN